MKKIKKFIYKNIKSIIISVLAIGLFIFTSWLSRHYTDGLSSLTFMGVYGELVYLVLAFFGALVAGISSTPLIPLSLVVWGANTTILLTALGWTIGSSAAFLLSRRFGEKLVCRIVNVCDLEDYQHRINSKSLFWKLLLARIFLPIDILSYAIGLFTKMSLISFVIATFIGSAIFTMLAVYASTLPVLVQIISGTVFLLIFFIWVQQFIKKTYLK